ncbi:MAG: tRNA (N(6)-L-threonylcarbamoyladenosine(37)-C(2))-methylthiotransferase MtaB [Planctomycetes bacterium]|nr:tRNA (N(6)-L-threonylcarbamoyladenosine(37)-C(2))-methylthiotransferase MtaB [Planctomycetota bacterium]
MKTFYTHTLGCKVNQYESQQIRQLLQNFGLKPVKLTQKPDLVVLNTCCVTHIASAKSRQSVRKIRKNNPKSTIIVAGCLPVGQPQELNELANAENLHIVSQKDLLAKTLTQITNNYQTSKPANADKIKDKSAFSTNNAINHADQDAKFEILDAYADHTRAFLKIQDGCDGYCTYCIVPKIRNKITSKCAKDALDEAYKLVYAGHKEIVLTGIFLGAYSQATVRRKRQNPDKTDALADLIAKIAQTKGLKRLRLSSLEPADVTDKLLDVFMEYPNIMPHLHLSLQSGSDRILKRMCRQYRIAEFMDIVAKVKNTLYKPAITTDIIVGFPGETDDDFQQTYDIAKQVAFSKMHVFSYSSRQGTPAAKLDGHLDPKVIKTRSKYLRQLDGKLQTKFRKQFIGQQATIIVEKTNPARGRTERYFIQESPNTTAKKGDLIEVTVS